VAERSLDLICIGRAGVDFYAQQIGSRLEDVSSFAKYIGGSSTNIACCSSRMGLQAALITRVGDDHMGRFIREQIQREGVDASHVVTDPQRLTALVVLGIEDRDTFPLIFFRENCADMAIALDDFDAAFIASARALLITGTHFSTPHVYEVSRAALRMARDNGVRTALDIDYRPVLWGLTTSRADGETRFVASASVSEHLQSILPEFDLVVGTAEEIHIAGGSTDTLQALRTIRGFTDAALVLKRGPYGASVYPGAIPGDLDEGITVPGVTVDVMNVLGAGDGFMAGFLRGWINEEGYEQALRYANACGALVVSRHGCTPAMPTVEELAYYLEHASAIERPDTHAELNYLHRVTTRRGHWDELCVLAFDHRAQLIDMAREVGADLQQLVELKQLLVQATAQAEEAGLQERIGILCDDTFGQDALNAATGRGWFIGRPVEQPKSRPLEFEGGASIGSRLVSWPIEHTVKCLVYYHPDDEDELRYAQEQRVIELYRACCSSGHELLLEIIPPADTADVGDALYRSIKRFYNLDVRPDWWKLPVMAHAAAVQVGELIEQRAPHCRGILVLGLDAPLTELAAGFREFAGIDQVKGFAVGRTIFSAPARAWLSGAIDDAALVQQVAGNYRAVLTHWRARND
jgi:5-dehydro-2-deoxygluconokinase